MQSNTQNAYTKIWKLDKLFTVHVFKQKCSVEKKRCIKYDRIRVFCDPYFPRFSPYKGKYESEKTRISTYFAHRQVFVISPYRSNYSQNIFVCD